jgi:hypothetical protein
VADADDENVIQRTTIDPGMAFGAIVVVDKVDYGKAPLEMKFSVDWNGERYPFSFLLTRQGKPTPAEYSSILAENTRPMALDRRWSNPASVSPAGVGAAGIATAERPPEGAILLPSGAVKVPAKTKSGYCLQAPPDYVATGDMNYPVITGAMPRCENVKDEEKKLVWQPLK